MHSRHAPARHKSRLTLWVFCALAILAALTLAPVALQPGWPMNHEFNLPWNFNSFYLRTQVYAEHMLQGDLFPIWSASDNAGFGSPQPLMYHKLFYLVSGALYAISGHMKASVLLSVWLFLMVGAMGTYRLCQALGCGRYFSACGAVLLLLANYTVTNWLLRGAMAEFSAAMLVPWVLAIFIRWLKAPDTRAYQQLGLLAVLIALVFLAHSVLAFYLVMLLTISFGCLILLRQLSLSALKFGPLAFGALIFAVIAGPYLVAMRTIGANYDMGRILPTPFLPENQIKPLRDYFWDTHWAWGKVWDSYSVQLDTPVLVLLLSGLLLLGFSRLSLKVKKSAEHANGKTPIGVGVWALVIITLLCMALQTGWAIPFYQHMPGAAFIQFPWRLLAVLTPGLIALSLYVWQRLSVAAAPMLVGSGVIASLILCGAWATLMYNNTPHDKAAEGAFRFGAFGEYIPTQAGTDPAYTFESIQSLLAAQDCTLLALSNFQSSEALEINFELRCNRAGTYPLPIFGSPLHQVWLTSKENGTTRQGCPVATETPGLCAVALSGPGAYLVQIKMPTFMGWAFQ